MKTNIFKYIFFTILIILIIAGIYILYKDGKKEKFKVENNELEINIVKELNIGITQYDTINPILSYNRDIQYIDKLIFRPLLNITSNFKIENELAKEFSKINSTTYIVKLKEDIYWHDGTKFTAQDVVFTIENLKNNEIKSIYKENVRDIKEVQKIDDYTIKILLKEGTLFFEYKMCFPILASNSYEEKTLNCKTTVPVGTGKYKILKTDENIIEIKKVNLDEESKLTKINIYLYNSANDLYTEIINNKVDFIITDNIEYEEYVGKMGYNVNYSTGREFEYLVLNNENKILSNKEIRKAISHSIDRQSINYNVYNNKYNISNFPLDYGSYLFNSNNNFEYDINKAKTILLENEWKYKNGIWQNENKKLEFDLLVNIEEEKRELVAEEIKKQLSEIGITINIVKVEKNRYNSYVKNKNYDMILTGNIISSCPNIETYLGENNLSNFNNQEVKYILSEIKNIDNEDIKKDKYLRLIQIYNEEIPFISLYYNSLFILSNSNLKGDLTHNWYNIFYNINNWYKVK